MLAQELILVNSLIDSMFRKQRCPGTTFCQAFDGHVCLKSSLGTIWVCLLLKNMEALTTTTEIKTSPFEG